MGKWPKIRSISFLRRVFFAGWFGRNHRRKSMSGLGWWWWWSNSTKFSWRKEFQTQVFFWFFKLGYFSDVVERNNVFEKPPLSQFHPKSYMEHVIFFLPWSELPTVTTGLGCNKVDTQRDFESPWEWAVAFLMLFRGNIVWITLKHDLCLIYVQYYLVYFCWRALTEH